MLRTELCEIICPLRVEAERLQHRVGFVVNNSRKEEVEFLICDDWQIEFAEEGLAIDFGKEKIMGIKINNRTISKLICQFTPVECCPIIGLPGVDNKMFQQ